MPSKGGLAAQERAREDAIADVIHEGVALAMVAGGFPSPDLERAMEALLHRGEELADDGASS